MRRIDAKRHRVNPHHHDAHAMVEGAHLFKLAFGFPGAHRQRDESLKNGPPIGIDTDVVPEWCVVLGTRLANEIAGEGDLALLTQRRDGLHDIRVGDILFRLDPRGDGRDIGLVIDQASQATADRQRVDGR